MSNTNDNTSEFNTGKVKLKKPPRISSVWLIPIFSLLLGLWMVVNHYRNLGPEVSITFKSAENLVAGKTKIKILNIDVGQVTHIDLNETHDGVIVRALLDQSVEDLLKTDSQFWIVKPRIGGGGVSGLETLLSGAYIELSPGKEEKRSEKFEGIEGFPLTPGTVDGLHITLSSTSNNLLSNGTEIAYRGFTAGKIENSRLSDDRTRTVYDVFISAPYDELITQNTHFWNISGISLETSAQGFTLKTSSIESVLTGGITFGVPNDLEPGDKVESERQFTLYADEESTYKRYYGHGLELLLTMPNSVRGLDVNATVEYRGIRVGQVSHVNPNHVSVPLDKGINVIVRLEPARLGLDDTEGAVNELKGELNKWVKSGFSAALKSGSVLTGKKFVSLDFYKPDADSKKGLVQQGHYYTLPTKDRGIGEIQEKMSSILGKLDSLPYQRIGNNANNTLGSASQALAQITEMSKQLNKMAASQHFNKIPVELNNTLESMQEVMKNFEPQQQLMKETQNTLKAAQETLAEMKPFMRTLNQQPNALIFDRAESADVQPKAAP